MKISKQARRDAKQLLQSCRVSGLLDEAKVRQAVQQVIAGKSRAATWPSSPISNGW
jgi:hypothetical protein